MEFSDYWHAVVRGWWLIAVFGAVGLVVALLVASPPKGHTQTYYKSTSIVGSPPTSQGSSSLIGGGISSDQILYYASTDNVMAETSRLSGLNISPAEMRSRIALVAPSSSNSGQAGGLSGQVNVSAVGQTAAEALSVDQAFVTAMDDYTNAAAKNSLHYEEQQTEATLATVMSDIATNNLLPGLTPQALQVQVSTLQNHLASLVVVVPGSGFQVVQAPAASSTFAVVTGTPTVVDNRMLRVIVGVVVGFLVGILAALALWMLDRRLKTAKRAQTALGYPVVAEIPFESSDSTEAYRMLWLAVFREPLPLPPADQNQQWYGDENPVLDYGVGGRSPQATRP